MDARSLSDIVAVSLLGTASAANTAEATSTQWVDVRRFEGDLAVLQVTGALTGSIAGQIQVADDANGTNAVNLTIGPQAGVFPAATAPGISVVSIPRNSITKPFIGYAGVVTTGPALVGAVLIGRQKYSG